MSKFFQILFIFLLLVSFRTNALFSQDVDAIIYHYTGQRLVDSKWGKIALLQESLSKNIQACGGEAIAINGKFDKFTQKSIIQLTSCPDFKELAVHPNDQLYGVVHTALWKRLLSEVPIPTVHERAFVLILSHEGTDYDQVL